MCICRIPLFCHAMPIRLLGSILTELDFFFPPVCSRTLLNWLKSEGDSNHVKFCMTSLSLFDLVPILCLKLTTPTLFLNSHMHLWRDVLFERKNKTWFFDCSQIILLSLSHFSTLSLDLFQINLNLIWKWVIRAAYHVQNTLVVPCITIWMFQWLWRKYICSAS